MIEDYINYIKSVKRFSTHTVVSYSNDIKQFLNYVHNDLLWSMDEDIGHEQVRSWMVHLMTDDIGAKSINRKISSLRSYFNYLLRIDRITRNPMSKVLAQKVPKRLPQVLQENEINKLLNGDLFSNDFIGCRAGIAVQSR